LNEVVSVVPNLIWAVAISPNIYYVCKSEWNSSNCTQVWMCFNYHIWLRLLEFSQMFLIVCKFQWSTCTLPKLDWSSL